MRNPFASFITLLFLTAVLAGCGFHLRGSAGSATILPDDWKSMHLITSNPNSEFSRALITRFEVNDVVWTDRQSANYLIKIVGPNFDQRNLTLNSAARAAELELTMTVLFTVYNADGSVVLAENKASIVKQMENNPRNVVGTSEEISLLKQEMHTELAQQVARRIGFFAASQEKAEAAAEIDVESESESESDATSSTNSSADSTPNPDEDNDAVDADDVTEGMN